MLNYSEPCERNKGYILEQLQHFFADRQRVLEIGSGSGQHALYFSENLPHLHWQPTDMPEFLDALKFNILHYPQPNVAEPQQLDVTSQPWPQSLQTDAVFTANTLHIMPAVAVKHFFRGVGEVLSDDGKVCIYGPFKYGGAFTTESNERFDAWLKRQNPLSGVRDFEWIVELADTAGLQLLQDVDMPANNQLLKFQRTIAEIPTA